MAVRQHRHAVAILVQVERRVERAEVELPTDFVQQRKVQAFHQVRVLQVTAQVSSLFDGQRSCAWCAERKAARGGSGNRPIQPCK
jgi:hypothetical protein